MLGQQGRFPQSGAACEQAEAEAVRLANEMRAEYWSVSAKTGAWVRGGRRGLRSGAGGRPVGGRTETPTPACGGRSPRSWPASQGGRGSRSVVPPPTRGGRSTHGLNQSRLSARRPSSARWTDAHCPSPPQPSSEKAETAATPPPALTHIPPSLPSLTGSLAPELTAPTGTAYRSSQHL